MNNDKITVNDVKKTLKGMIANGLVTSFKKNGEELFKITERGRELFKIKQRGEDCARSPRVYAASKASVTKTTVKINAMIKAHNYACGARKAALTRKRRSAARKAVATRRANQQKALLTR